MAISNLYFNENWLWKSRKNEQVTLEIEEPVTLRGGGGRGRLHWEVYEVRGVQLETPGM